MKNHLNRSGGLKVIVSLLLAVALASTTLFTSDASAICRLDWDLNGYIDLEDYLQGNPMSGFYPEWYVHSYYPSYYPTLFPQGDLTKLDYDGNGLVEMDDLMGPMDAASQSEGFYVEWYIYIYYRAYYPVFLPEYTCGEPCAYSCLAAPIAEAFCRLDGGFECSGDNKCCLPPSTDCPHECIAGMAGSCEQQGGISRNEFDCGLLGTCCEMP